MRRVACSSCLLQSSDPTVCMAGDIRAVVWGVQPKTETAPARFDAHVLTLQYDVDPLVLHVKAVQMLCLTEYPLHAVISDPTNDGVLVAASPLTDIPSFEQHSWGTLHLCLQRWCTCGGRCNAAELRGCCMEAIGAIVFELKNVEVLCWTHFLQIWPSLGRSWMCFLRGWGPVERKVLCTWNT